MVMMLEILEDLERRFPDECVPAPAGRKAIGFAIEKMPKGWFWVLGGPSPLGQFTANATPCVEGMGCGPTLEVEDCDPTKAMYRLLHTVLAMKVKD